MTPEQLAAPNTESAHQTAFFCWAQQHRKTYPCLQFMYAVPNGGLRNAREAANLVKQGVRRGVPDVCLPFPRIRYGMTEYHGLYIEFKRPKTEGKAEGRLSPDQVRWQEYLTANRYRHFVAYDYLTAIEALLNYLN